MFTGIIEGFGTISGLQKTGKGSTLTITSDFDLDRTKVGDSIAVNGACVTVVSLEGRRFAVDVSPETMDKTVLKSAGIGDRVNLERALRLSDRLDGHLVLGHVDDVGRISRRTIQSNAVITAFEAPSPLLRYMIPKGSVAVDGVSLTINRLHQTGFEVSIIPHTARMTTIGTKRIGDPVNIETDIIGKYIERFMTQGRTEVDASKDMSGISLAFLAKNGYL